MLIKHAYNNYSYSYGIQRKHIEYRYHHGIPK